MYLNCIVLYDLNYLNLFTIEQLIYYNLKNDSFTCPNCGYNKHEQIIDANIKNYYKTIINVYVPVFIFIGFELSHEDDLYNKKHKLNSITTMNLLCYNRMEENINLILEKILEKITVYNTNYFLKAVICSPFSGHFSGLIINLEDNYKNLEPNNNYYYDDYINNHEIIKIDNFKDILKDNIPFILIYKKE